MKMTKPKKTRSEYIKLLAKLLNHGYTLVWYPYGYSGCYEKPDGVEMWICHHPSEQLHLIAPTTVFPHHYNRKNIRIKEAFGRILCKLGVHKRPYYGYCRRNWCLDWTKDPNVTEE